jgi:sugar (pentulose or hexulose) kinase
VPGDAGAVVTLDLGTSATKGALWRGNKLVAIARAPLDTRHPLPGRAEQDARSWWASVVDVCVELRDVAPDLWGTVTTVGFSAARETFALFDADLEPLGPAILWSDRRAAGIASGDAAELRALTGVVPNAAAHVAKLAWIAREEPELLARSRWILQPRDFVVARLTGNVLTDGTLASRTGLCALEGGWLDRAVAAYGDRLPPIVGATTVAGTLRRDAADALSLPGATQVVTGAGDRACEVLGTGATPDVPMVSWGTTGNVSVPHPGPGGLGGAELPAVAAVSKGALGGFVVEAGVSAAGAALGWLSALTGVLHDDLLSAAAGIEPGAGGLLALPWLAGARGPWWEPDTHAAFLGLTEAHGPGALARAVVEGIALDVARCVELVAPRATALGLAGAGAGHRLWREILSATTGLPLHRRALPDAASVGARLLVAASRREKVDVEALNPVIGVEAPDPARMAAYRPVREASDRAAAAVLGLTAPS